MMKPWKALSLLAALLISACSAPVVVEQPTAAQAPSQPAPATSAPLPQPTVPVQSPLPTEPAPTQPAPPQSATQAARSVTIYLVAIDDQGKSGTAVGCGDSLVPVQVQVPPTQAVLRASLDALLGIKEQHYGQSGLYNALYQSDLKVEKISLQDGAATVYLTGTLQLGGECDNPRVQAQLEQTVRQFPSITSFDIFLNDKPLKDALSLK
jgi:hypothetical protein